MSIKRLSVGQLQLYFDDQGIALFSDATKRDRAAVETVLGEYQDFIDRWLESSEKERPRYITVEERELRGILKGLGQDLLRTRRFDSGYITTVIQEVAKHLGARFPTLTEAQISQSVDDVVSLL
jgi:hypothetical protein